MIGHDTTGVENIPEVQTKQVPPDLFTALTVRYLTRRYIWEYQSEMEQTYSHTVKLDDDSLTFEIRDTLEKAETCRRESGIRWADAFLVVYSITDKDSFSTALQLVESIYDGKGTDEVHVALVGNKSDLEHLREVEAKEGKSAAGQLGCMFFEVSAADSYDNVQESLNSLFRKVCVSKRCLQLAHDKRKNGSKKHVFGNALFRLKSDRRQKAKPPRAGQGHYD